MRSGRKMHFDDVEIATFRRELVKGTSNNCHRSSGAPNLPTNDSALFSFRFCAVHPKDLRDSQLRQLFEVPLSMSKTTILMRVIVPIITAGLIPLGTRHMAAGIGRSLRVRSR